MAAPIITKIKQKLSKKLGSGGREKVCVELKITEQRESVCYHSIGAQNTNRSRLKTSE